MMKKYIFKTLTALLILLLCLSTLLISVNAAAVDTQKDSSLTLVYKHNSTLYNGLDIKIYRIADAQQDYSFDLTAPFDFYPVNIYKIQSQDEWRTVTKTLKSYIIADKILETAAGKTDEYGTVVFNNLRPGIYLTLGLQNRSGNSITEFEDFLTIIPRQNENMSFSYDVTAYPKCNRWSVGGGDPKDSNKIYKVVKQWKDNGKLGKRTKSVTVDIYRDGIKKETVTLSSANTWKYSWRTKDDGAQWTVVERNIPEDYTVTIKQSGTTFIITNTYHEDNSNPPEDNPPPIDDNPPPSGNEGKRPPPEDEDNPPPDEYNPPMENTPTPDETDKPNSSEDRDKPTSQEESGVQNPIGVPQTGDTSSIYQYIILMCLSGLLLIIISVSIKRKKS